MGTRPIDHRAGLLAVMILVHPMFNEGKCQSYIHTEIWLWKARCRRNLLGHRRSSWRACQRRQGAQGDGTKHKFL